MPTWKVSAPEEALVYSSLRAKRGNLVNMDQAFFDPDINLLPQISQRKNIPLAKLLLLLTPLAY
ncbi:MAG: hypothetical protein KAJ06_06370, partial [Gammaproteobacteria bacterium]|nr:hypothetical protein [Gammaproteobacteria bacterium]